MNTQTTHQALTVGGKLLPEHVAMTQHQDIPTDLQMYQDDVSGAQSLLRRLQLIAGRDGGIVQYAICRRWQPLGPEPGAWVCDQIVTVGLCKVNRKVCFRYCCNGEPNSVESSSVVSTWYDYCADPASVAAELCYQAQGTIFILAD